MENQITIQPDSTISMDQPIVQQPIEIGQSAEVSLTPPEQIPAVINIPVERINVFSKETAIKTSDPTDDCLIVDVVLQVSLDSKSGTVTKRLQFSKTKLFADMTAADSAMTINMAESVIDTKVEIKQVGAPAPRVKSAATRARELAGISHPLNWID